MLIQVLRDCIFGRQLIGTATQAQIRGTIMDKCTMQNQCKNVQHLTGLLSNWAQKFGQWHIQPWQETNDAKEIRASDFQAALDFAGFKFSHVNSTGWICLRRSQSSELCQGLDVFNSCHFSLNSDYIHCSSHKSCWDTWTNLFPWCKFCSLPSWKVACPSPFFNVGNK